MTYSEQLNQQLRIIKRFNQMIYMNLIIFSFAILVGNFKIITKGCIFISLYFGLILLKIVFEKSTKRSKINQLEIQEQHGDEEIITSYGLYVTSNVLRHSKKITQKIVRIIVCFCYSTLVLFLGSVIYSLFISNSQWVLIFALLHVFLFVFIYYLLPSLIKNEYIFTSSNLIISYNKIVSYQHITKYQFIKLVNGGFILDINAGSVYIRMHISDSNKAVIEELLS